LEDTTNRGDKPGQMGDALPTLKLGTGRTAKSLALSTAGGCALLDNDTLKCWGQNSFGQLGQENIIAMGDKPGSMGDQLPTVNLGQGRTVKAIASGDFSYCALLDNATVKCWGRNHLGQLGIEDLVNRGDDPGEMGDALPSINLGGSLALKQIAASGIGAMCAMVGNVNGYVGLKCWGGNPSGGLGLGDTMNRGGTSASMGDMLPLIDLGVNTIPATFRTGGRTCVQFSDGTLKCWGGNARGQLGLGDINNRGDIPGEMGAALPVIDLGQGKRVKAFAMGGVSTCAIVTGNIVKCWGGNDSGALGLGVASANDDRGDAPNEMGDKLPAVDLW
jgi:hypothetical protein